MHRRIVVGILAAGLAVGSAAAYAQIEDDPGASAEVTQVTDPAQAAEIEQTIAGMMADAEATASKQDDAR